VKLQRSGPRCLLLPAPLALQLLSTSVCNTPFSSFKPFPSNSPLKLPGLFIHRPLLSYKTVLSSNSPDGLAGSTHLRASDPFQCLVPACRDAAPQISNIWSMPIFKQAADTYVVLFVSPHLFTVGVALSIMTSIDSPSQEFQEVKMRLRRLIEM